MNIYDTALIPEQKITLNTAIWKKTVPEISVDILDTQQSAPVGISCTFSSLSASHNLIILTSPVTIRFCVRCSHDITKPAPANINNSQNGVLWMCVILQLKC